MATANSNDMQTLATDPVFGLRVMALATIFCIGIDTESITSTNPNVLHAARKNLAAAILNNQTTYKPILVQIAATNQTVANDATATATIVGQTGATLATSALLCTDTHISAAVAAGFNALIPNV